MAEWGWIAVLIFNALVALSVRGIKAEAKEEATKAVTGVSNEVANVKLDLARNYVQKSDLDEFRADQKTLIAKVTSIQLVLASRFGLSEREGDLES